MLNQTTLPLYPIYYDESESKIISCQEKKHCFIHCKSLAVARHYNNTNTYLYWRWSYLVPLESGSRACFSALGISYTVRSHTATPWARAFSRKHYAALYFWRTKWRDLFLIPITDRCRWPITSSQFFIEVLASNRNRCMIEPHHQSTYFFLIFVSLVVGIFCVEIYWNAY